MTAKDECQKIISALDLTFRDEELKHLDKERIISFLKSAVECFNSGFELEKAKLNQKNEILEVENKLLKAKIRDLESLISNEDREEDIQSEVVKTFVDIIRMLSIGN